MMKMLSNQFKERLFAGSLTLTLVFVSIFFSFHPFFKPIFIGLNILLICFALIEYYHLVQHKGFQPLVYPALSCSVTYMVASAFSLDFRCSAFPNLILLASFILLFVIFFRHSSPVGNLAVTIFGIIYLTIPLSCAMRINYFFPVHEVGDGRLWLFYVLMVSKSTDVGGYFIGKWKGKTKLAPITSPKKTLEGAAGGFCVAMSVSILFGLFYSNQPDSLMKITIPQSIWLGLVISVLAQLGDLTESLLKRDAGVKDSNRLPGLGGVLDTVDSLVFTLPFMYIFLQMEYS